MNRGSDIPARSPPLGLQASMRPRFMNRGSAAWLADTQRDDFASMRPRFMNRGSLTGDYLGLTYSSCFNEAPIHESGKCER